MNENDARWLEKCERYFVDYVKPRAEQIDLSSKAVADAFWEMGSRGLLSLRRPEEFGGPAMTESAFRQFQQMASRYSGTLAFLMTQHQTAVSLIAKSGNHELKERTLPHMASGELALGIGISQLRRSGDPVLKATPITGGYELSGSVPWITGFGIFHGYAIGATLPDGRLLFALTPLEGDGGTFDWGEISGEVVYSQPMELAAMESAQTVSAKVEKLFVSESVVLDIKPADWALTNDRVNIVLQGHFAMGCAQAGIDSLREASQMRKSAMPAQVANQLQQELDDCRAQATTLEKDGDETVTDAKLNLRAWAIELAVRCAQAAVAGHSGRANSIHHPAQRIYREALVFTVSAQTEAIMEVTLLRLVDPKKRAPNSLS